MHVTIEDTCTACGICCDTCPEVFILGDVMAELRIDEIPPEYEASVEEAAEECPAMAINIEE